MSDDSFGPILLPLVIAGLYFTFSDSDWSNSVWYSFKYNVGFKDVSTEPKPDDCDFLRSPMGFKGCSYKARVRVFNAERLRIAGDDPPIFSNDIKTGVPVVSYDNGKYWGLDTSKGDRKPSFVEVTWIKQSS